MPFTTYLTKVVIYDKDSQISYNPWKFERYLHHGDVSHNLKSKHLSPYLYYYPLSLGVGGVEEGSNANVKTTVESYMPSKQEILEEKMSVKMTPNNPKNEEIINSEDSFSERSLTSEPNQYEKDSFTVFESEVEEREYESDSSECEEKEFVEIKELQMRKRKLRRNKKSMKKTPKIKLNHTN